MSQPKTQSVGALWLNKTETGRQYLSGRIKVNGVEMKIAVFKNEEKSVKAHPDYVIKARVGVPIPAQGAAPTAHTPTSFQPYTRSGSQSRVGGDKSEGL